MNTQRVNRTPITGLKAKTAIKAGIIAVLRSGKATIETNHNQTIGHGLKVRSSVKAGMDVEIHELSVRVTVDRPPSNHNQTVVRGLKVKSDVKAGGLTGNHNQIAVRSLKVKSGVKSGFNPQPDPPGVCSNHNQTSLAA
ncbi:MAG: hypothetical protein JST85_04055 [Acidobacteria bacterium]|nr:hypothetical protein [Acidobacteriota bacterium]